MHTSNPQDCFESLLAHRARGEAVVLVTVITKEGHGPAAVGARMLVNTQGRQTGTVGGGALEHLAIKKSQEILASGRGGIFEKYDLSASEHAIIPEATATGMICGGSVGLFYEFHGVGEPLVVFGAGHIGRALARIIPGLGFRLTVVDSRQDYIDDFLGAAQTICHDYGQSFAGLELPSKPWLVIATHSHALDYQVLEQVFRAGIETRYLGVVASRSKRDRFFSDIKTAVPGADPSQVYMPCGLNLGGVTPEEIAISILSEIQAIRYERSGHFHMKDRK